MRGPDVLQAHTALRAKGVLHAFLVGRGDGHAVLALVAVAELGVVSAPAQAAVIAVEDLPVEIGIVEEVADVAGEGKREKEGARVC